MVNQLQISPRFFKQERNNYSDWGFAFWRELTQNAIDARSYNIKINVFQEGNVADISFEDDGCGFDRNVRDSVYFNLGETSKTDTSTIGGFGKARIITCFSHNWYEIHSRDWNCKGIGSSYEVGESQPVRGCVVKVGVDATDAWNHTVDMLAKLREFLGYSQMNCNVTINGERFGNWCYRRKLARSLSFGNIYVNKSGGLQNTLIIRASGVPMFVRNISAEAQVVVEINPEMSRTVLLSNRDSLHSRYQNELDLFMQSLAVDTKSALRSNPRRVIMFDGKPKLTRRKETAKKETKEVSVVEFLLSGTISLAAEIGNASSPVDKTTEEHHHIVDADDMIPSAIVVCETENPLVRKVVQKYDPTYWNENGGNRKKLLRQWTIVCEFAIEEWLNVREREEVEWRPGFYFADDSGACQMVDSTDTRCLMLNPVDDKGLMRYRLRSRKDWVEMVQHACHEVTHFTYDGHNENFTSMYGELVRRVFCRLDVIFKTLLMSLGKKSVQES